MKIHRRLVVAGREDVEVDFANRRMDNVIAGRRVNKVVTGRKVVKIIVAVGG